MTTTRIDTAEVARMVRATLKKSFPTTAFQVLSKRYSGGSSIDVSWTDGPTVAQVESYVGHMHGDKPYQNDFIFFSRSYSEPVMLGKVAKLCQTFAGLENMTVADIDKYSPDLQAKWYARTLRELAYRELQDVSL